MTRLHDCQLAPDWQLESSFFVCKKQYQQKTTWDDVGAHSTIPAEHVQSQVARATANNLNICQDEYRRRSNKNCKQTGLQYFPAIPGRFRWLPTSTICLILLFVTSCTLRQVQKTESSYSVEYIRVYCILLLFWPPSAAGLGWSHPPNWPKLVCPRSRNICSGKGIRVQCALSDQQYTARFCTKNAKLQT